MSQVSIQLVALKYGKQRRDWGVEERLGRRRKLLGGRFGIRMEKREKEGIQGIWKKTSEKEGDWEEGEDLEKGERQGRRKESR
jgi:hypothetical protein